MALDNLQNYMIGVVFFVIVISGGAFMMSSFYSADPTIDTIGDISTFNASLNKANDITLAVDDIDGSIQSITAEDAGALGWLDALVGSTFSGLQALGHTLGFMNVATAEAANILGVPPFIIPLILLVVIIIIGFAIWSAIMRQ